MAISFWPDSNFGDVPYFNIGNSNAGEILRAYLRFDLSEIPINAVIVSADLKLYQGVTIGSEDFIISVHKLTQNWQESNITWNNQPNYNAMPESTTPAISGEETWLSWDITTLFQKWLDGSTTNYGIVLKGTDEALGNTYIVCHSSDYSIASLRPKIEITYLAPAP